jgi:hypothetical protein
MRRTLISYRVGDADLHTTVVYLFAVTRYFVFVEPVSARFEPVSTLTHPKKRKPNSAE